MSVTPVARANPYVGPRSFDRSEADQFRGRGREIDDLVYLLIAERIVLLYSPSGAGKTSLLQAGVLPKLEQNQFRVLPIMRVGQEPPPALALPAGANRYIVSLLLSLEEAFATEEQLPLDQLYRLSLEEYLNRRVDIPGGDGQLVLIFDQFEEILTIGPGDVEQKRDFFSQVGAALKDRRRWAIFSMREDYIAGLDPYRQLIPNQLRDTFRLDLLAIESARLAIEEPAGRVGVHYSEAAITRLLQDLSRITVLSPEGEPAPVSGRTIEPVQLQVVCSRLLDRLPEETDTIGELEITRIGDVNKALSEYYAEKVAQIAEQAGVNEREIRGWVERRLITAQDIRSQVLMGPQASDGLANRAIGLLIDAHLLRRERRRGATWFELAHDRLIGPIRADNADWSKQHLSPLQQQANLWVEQGRSGPLLQGKALREAERWARDHADALSSTDQDYLEACRDADRSAQRLARLLWVAWGLFGVAVLTSVWAIMQSVEATRLAENSLAVAVTAQTAEAVANAAAVSLKTAEAKAAAEAAVAQTAQAQAVQNAREGLFQTLAAQAIVKSTEKVDLAALLGVEAYRRNTRSPGSQAAIRNSLYSVLSANSNLKTFFQVEGTAVNGLAFNNARTLLIAGDSDGKLYFWDLAQNTLRAAPISSNDCSCGITSLAVSRDDLIVAVGSRNNKVALFELATGRAIGTTTIDNDVESLAISPVDSGLIAIGGADGRVYLWRRTQLESAPVALGSHENTVYSIAFSPDGARLASGGADRTVRLWDVQKVAAIGDPLTTDSSNSVRAVAFSPNGATLASSQYRDIYLWDLRPLANDAPAVLNGPPLIEHTSWVYNLAFVGDSNSLVSVGSDRTTLIWDLSERRSTSEYILNSAPVNRVAVSADGSLIATGGSDSRVSLLSNNGPAWLAQRAFDGSTRGRVLQLALLGDATPLALVRRDDSSKDTADFSIRRADRPPPDSADIKATPIFSYTQTTASAMSADASLVAIGFIDGRVTLWDAQGNPVGQAPEVAPQTSNSDRGVWAIAFSPDGRYLAWGDDDGRILIWDVQSPDSAPRALPYGRDAQGDAIGQTWRVTALAFSDDSRLLASGSWDNQAIVWDLADDTMRGEPFDTREDVASLRFSPDSRLLAAGGEQSVFLLDITGDERSAAPLTSHRNNVISLAFNAAGDMLASGSIDRTVVLWDVARRERIGQPLAIRPAEGWVRSVAFQSDERLIVAYDFGIWYADLNLDSWARYACAIANRELSREEWRRYFGDEPQRDTCEATSTGQP